jgi:hypothetical protein
MEISIKDAIESISDTIIFDCKDHAENRRDAWLYGIIIGWNDEAMDVVSEKFQFNKNRLKKLHNSFKSIAKTEKQLAELREKLRWIPVSERLPEKTCRVEVTTSESIYWIRDFIFDDYDSVESFKRFVKKWRLIPELEDGE